MTELTAEAAREKFAQFLGANPYSEIPEPEEGAALLIARPWGDPSLALALTGDGEALAEALDNLVLPERLSAVWHSDSRSLEVVWTARRLQEQWQEVVDRKFTFSFKGHEHACHFTTSSDRVLAIARAVRPQTTTETQFRNMQSLAAYVQARDTGGSMDNLDRPLSFWISDVDWDETSTFELISSLNFHLTYYDAISPIIIVHDVSNESRSVVQRTRYLKAKFPDAIAARPLDPNLIAFWQAASTSNPMMRFILYYRMIEYCAGQYIEHSVRSELRRIVSAPDLQDDLKSGVERIIAAVSMKQLEEIQRFKAVVRQNVDPHLLWADINANREALSKDITFDGGFSIKPLIGPTEDESAFCTRPLDAFSDQLRKIRNALSHGKDQETAGVILPTPQNMDLLRPWVHLIATAAGEVVVYKDVS